MTAVNRPFPADATSTAIALAYRNPAETLIGQRVLPAVPVLSETFKYAEYPLAENFTVPNLAVGRKSRPQMVEFSKIEKTASVADYALDDGVPQSDIEEARRARLRGFSAYDPEKAAVEGITNLLQLGREIRAAELVQDKANYSPDRVIALAGEDKLSNYKKSDPYGVLDEAMDKTLIYRPNTAVMGKKVWNMLKRHPRLIKAVKGGVSDGADGFITRAQFADLLEISPANLFIGESLLNTARKGQDVKLERVWGNFIALLYINPAKRQANDEVISWGFTAEYGRRQSGKINDPDMGAGGGSRIRVWERCRELAVAKEAGVLLPEVI